LLSLAFLTLTMYTIDAIPYEHVNVNYGNGHPYSEVIIFFLCAFDVFIFINYFFVDSKNAHSSNSFVQLQYDNEIFQNVNYHNSIDSREKNHT
jgi:hypothetical protein